MTDLVVVYHSGAGHTKAIAESVVRGAELAQGVDVCLLDVNELTDCESPLWTTLDKADGIVFGSPTYMGTVSAAFKLFMDATGARWYSRKWMDKIAAGFTVGGGLSGDKQGTLQAMHTMACQHGMIWVSMGVGVGEEGIDRLSSSLGMMAQAGDAPADQTPPKEDHVTAERFGHRVAIATKRWSST